MKFPFLTITVPQKIPLLRQQQYQLILLFIFRDPITEFIEHLYVNFDFEAARRKLNQCQAVLLTDFFLIACLEEFVENARLMIFETFCRIHQVISIG